MLIKHWSCCYDHIITLVTQVIFKVYNDNNNKFVTIKENEEIEPNLGSMPSIVHDPHPDSILINTVFQNSERRVTFWGTSTLISTLHRYALKKKLRYYLGIFPKWRTPPPHPPLLGTPYSKKKIIVHFAF